jgi:epoxide hydrolase-like predicted phosphatase
LFPLDDTRSNTKGQRSRQRRSANGLAIHAWLAIVNVGLKLSGTLSEVMKVVKAILFDFGGVLLRTQDHQGRRKWEEKLGLEEWELEVIVFGSEMGTKAQMGEISYESLWDWIGRRFNLSSQELKDFQHDFWAGDELDSDLVDYIRSLKRDYQIALISNASDNLRQNLKNQHGIADAFDLIVCSAEEHVMKPHKEIYLRTLERLDCEPAEAVFVDDSEPNVQAARKLGISSIHFRPSTDLPSEFVKLGINGGDR